MQRDYIFFAGRRIAWRDSSGNVYCYFADAIGSTRAVTTATGTVCFSADYYPYGQENAWCASRMPLRDDYDTSCLPTYKFAPFASRMDLRDTGHEHDSETGNAFFASRTDLRDYYAYARYYNPRLGRSMTQDFTLADVGSPQSMNGYAYIANNPTSYAGPREMPAVFGAPGGSSAEASVAALTAGGSTVSIAGTLGVFGDSQGWTGPASTPVPAHPLGATLQMAEAAEMEARALLAYLRSHAPKPSSPYSDVLSHLYSEFCAGLAPSPPGAPAPQALCSPFLQPAPTYESIEAKFSLPSTTADANLGLALYELGGMPKESDIPIGSNLLGDWLDPGFPQFDLKMFFGGGGSGGELCLPTPSDMDPCSL